MDEMVNLSSSLTRGIKFNSYESNNIETFERMICRPCDPIQLEFRLVRLNGLDNGWFTPKK